MYLSYPVITELGVILLKGAFLPFSSQFQKIFDERYDEINDEDESKPVFEDNELEEG